jgi:hypothetical protein
MNRIEKEFAGAEEPTPLAEQQAIRAIVPRYWRSAIKTDRFKDFLR